VKIFVSYSRRDAGDFARQIHEFLKDEHDVFTDVNNIQMGSVWSNVIGNNISNCDLFVIILTHASLRSPHVETEVLQAQKENKVIIPCFHSSVRNDEIKWNLSVLQGFDFNNEFDLVRKLGLFSKEKASGKKDDSKLKDISKLKDDSTDKAATKSEQEIGGGPIGPSMLSTKPRRISLKILLPIIGVAIIVSIAALTFSGVFTKNIKNMTTMTTTNGSAVEFNSRGDNLYVAGKYQEAITYYDKALAIDPKYAGSLNGKAKALISLGQYNEAIPYLSKALEIEPSYEDALSNKGIALVNIGHYSEALKSIDSALAINPNDSYALNAKGSAFDGLGNYKEAITYYDKALAINPNFVEVLYNKGLDLNNLGKPEEAITYFDKAISANPNYSDAYTNKGSSLLSLGKYKEAIKLYS
jgi:tetratricopeptide (TPR) repeat protein